MSVWSGIAAAGLAIALAFVAVGQPTWEWRFDTAQLTEVWAYGPLSVHHTITNKTSGVVEVSRDYSYDQLAALQPHMAQAFGEFEMFFLLGLVAAFAGVALSFVSYWKKIRGIFAGVAFLGGCAAILYATFAVVFTIPPAATVDLTNMGGGIPEFRGQTYDPASGNLLAWTPLLGWGLAIVAGLALAWASSDLWHVAPVKKGHPLKAVAVPATQKPMHEVRPLPPPPPSEVVIDVPPEPVIEEVFLIGANGLLIKHMSRSLMSDKDRDVVGSMISAISSFVREAFSERDGEVHEVSLGDHRFVMCNESGTVVAVLVTAGQTEDIVHRLRHLLAVLQDRYGDRLSQWSGEAIEGIEDELSVLWDPYHVPPPPAPWLSR
ncbi:MAG TPA: hypothetical protein VEO20_04495 [Thermoplasmata archaeon]|nr:hypothetical protein [Thermoplasmata archaeon]